jgi:hypothetical protein
MSRDRKKEILKKLTEDNEALLKQIVSYLSMARSSTNPF